jgi:ABC-type uncharacterized transport system ATPase subunit
LAGLLEVRDLRRSFGGLEAVAGIDLDLEPGGLLCLIGPNGCGKTTFFNLLSGELRPSGGRIDFQGTRIDGLRRHRIARRGIVRKLQVPGVYLELSVRENLAVPLFAGPGRRGLRGLLERQDLGEAIRALLALAGLAAAAERPAGELAHGQKQRLEIAMVLAARPALMLLDEPTAGMTAAETRTTAALLRRLHRETGIAMIVIEHDLAFVRQMACEVAVMIQGRLVARGDYDEVRTDPAVRAAYLGRRG